MPTSLKDIKLAVPVTNILPGWTSRYTKNIWKGMRKEEEEEERERSGMDGIRERGDKAAFSRRLKSIVFTSGYNAVVVVKWKVCHSNFILEAPNSIKDAWPRIYSQSPVLSFVVNLLYVSECVYACHATTAVGSIPPPFIQPNHQSFVNSYNCSFD